MEPRILWISGREATQPWAAQWNALAAKTPQAQPSLSHAWVDAFAYALMPEDGDLRCVLALYGDILAGVLPLVVRENRSWPITTQSLSTPYHEHSAFGDLLVEARWASDVVPALLAGACSITGVRLREMALRGIAHDSPTTTILTAKPTRIALISSHRSWGSYLPVKGTWRDHRGTLSGNFRANLRKAHNRLLEPGMSRFRFDWLTAERATAQHLDSFLQLEASGWKGRAGSAIEQNGRLRCFYKKLAENTSRLGWLEWHFMSLDEKPIAAHLAIRLGRSLCLIKIAYDESHARLSPGNLLFEATAERSFERDDLDEINCLTDMAWHRGWNMARREYIDARFYPHTVFALGFGLLPRLLIRVAKQTAKAFPVLGRIRARLEKRRAQGAAPNDRKGRA